MSSVDVVITGMHCGGCVRRVKAALDQVPALQNLEVKVGTVHADLDEDVSSDPAAWQALQDEIKESVSKLGFTVTGLSSDP